MTIINFAGWMLYAVAGASDSSASAQVVPFDEEIVTLHLPAPPAPEALAIPAPAASEDELTLSDDELQLERGGTGSPISNQKLLALVTGNYINGDYRAGDISLSDSALSNFSGLGNLVINTGAQASLQAGMSLTINIAGE